MSNEPEQTTEAGSGTAGGAKAPLGPPPDTIATPPPSRDHLIQVVFPIPPQAGRKHPKADHDVKPR